MTEVLAIGLDLSTTASGVARVWGETRTIKPKAGGAKDPARRLQEIVYRLDAWLRCDRPDVAVIEGYSMGGARGLAAFRLGELGGAVRVRLFELDIPFVEVPPTSLKHFATGNGRADKAAMVEAAKYRGAEVANDNEADAWHLRRVALAFYAGGELSDALRRLPWPALEERSS